MIDGATLSAIRLWALRERLSIREIPHRTRLSRNTIRKYLRADTVQPTLEARKLPTELDPFASRLSTWLQTQANRPRKQRRTIKQMFPRQISQKVQSEIGKLLNQGSTDSAQEQYRGACEGREEKSEAAR